MSQTTTPSGAQSLASFNAMIDLAKAHLCRAEIDDATKGHFRIEIQSAESAWHAVAALIARNAELEAERATLKEEWFMCCHPAWPDPLPCWGGKADAIDTINRHPHPDAWLLRTLRGGRIEYKGAALEALASTPAKENDDG